MKSIKRSLRLVSILILAFIAGMIMLVLKIQREAGFYISHSNHAELGLFMTEMIMFCLMLMQLPINTEMIIL